MNYSLNKELPLKWRVKSVFPTKANATHLIFVPYVDGRQVQALLDQEVGAANWQTRYFDCKNKQFCEIGLKIGGEWIWKGDSGSETSVEGSKGETTDSFKRAAVHWGINRKSYELSEVKIPCKIIDNIPYPINDKNEILNVDQLYNACFEQSKIDVAAKDLQRSLEQFFCINPAAKSAPAKAEKPTRATPAKKLNTKVILP